METARLWAAAALAAASLSLCPPAAAAPETKQDRSPTAVEVTLLVATEALIAFDLVQTIQGQRQGFTESNPLLGEHPGTARVLLFGSLSALAVAGVWYALPRTARLFPTVAVLVIELATVLGNAWIGMGPIRFQRQSYGGAPPMRAAVVALRF